MHALLAHAYHLALHGLDILTRPVFLCGAVSLVVALGGRLAGLARHPRGAALVAGVSVLSGWLLLDPAWASWPLPPLARLPGLGLIALGALLWRGPRAMIAMSAVAAWWLRGAPWDGPGLLFCLPVFLGIAAALMLTRRAARADAGWGHAAASMALALSLLPAGAAAHWAQASLPLLLAALALPGVEGVGTILPILTVMLAADALVASDRGLLIPVDVACLTPLLAWPLTRTLATRLGRAGPASAALLAAGLCTGLVWVVRLAMWGPA